MSRVRRGAGEWRLAREAGDRTVVGTLRGGGVVSVGLGEQGTSNRTSSEPGTLAGSDSRSPKGGRACRPRFAFFFFLSGMWGGRCVTHLLCPQARDPKLLRTLGAVAGPRSSRLVEVSQLDKNDRLLEGLKWGRGRCPLFPWSSWARVPEGVLSPSWASLHPTSSCVIHRPAAEPETPSALHRYLKGVWTLQWNLGQYCCIPSGAKGIRCG